MNDKSLVVDDSKFARMMLIKTLQDGNFNNIVEAASAKETLEVFVKENPALTFLDISLPDSEDLTLLEKLLNINPVANIIMCSALGQQLVVDDALKKGAKSFISKPFDGKNVLDLVVNLVIQK